MSLLLANSMIKPKDTKVPLDTLGPVEASLITRTPEMGFRLADKHNDKVHLTDKQAGNPDPIRQPCNEPANARTLVWANLDPIMQSKRKLGGNPDSMAVVRIRPEDSLQGHIPNYFGPIMPKSIVSKREPTRTGLVVIPRPAP